MNNGNLVTTIEIKDRQGRVIDTKEVVTYAGLLNRAHQEGLKKVLTELIQAPSKANEMTAICMAEVVTEKGVFRDYGDANPDNVNSRIAPHIIRMAATRAKARAFRDAVNIGVVAVEELALECNGGNGDNGRSYGDERIGGKTGLGTAERSQKRQRSPADSRHAASESEPMTEAQRRYLFRLLAERQIEGDGAQSFLLEALKVKSLSEVTKAQASALIEELLKPAKQVEEVPF